MAVLGYVSLRQWAAAAEVLFREQARDVDTHILRLRKKFEIDPERAVCIQTAHGQGYRLVAP